MGAGGEKVNVGREKNVLWGEIKMYEFARRVDTPLPMPSGAQVAKEITESSTAPRRKREKLEPPGSLMGDLLETPTRVQRSDNLNLMPNYLQKRILLAEANKPDSSPLLQRKASSLQVSLHLKRMQPFSETDQADLLKKLDPIKLSEFVQQTTSGTILSKLHPATLCMLATITGNFKELYEKLETEENKTKFIKSLSADLLKKLDPTKLSEFVQTTSGTILSELYPATLFMLARITGNPKELYEKLETDANKKKFIKSVSNEYFMHFLGTIKDGQEKVTLCRFRLAGLHEEQNAIRDLFPALTNLFFEVDLQGCQNSEELQKIIEKRVVEGFKVLNFDISHFKEVIHVYKDSLLKRKSELKVAFQPRVAVKIAEKLLKLKSPVDDKKKAEAKNEVMREIRNELAQAKNQYMTHVQLMTRIIEFKKEMPKTIELCTNIYFSLQSAYNYINENKIRELDPKKNTRLEHLFKDLSKNCKKLSSKIRTSFQSVIEDAMKFKLGADYIELEPVERAEKPSKAKLALPLFPLEDPKLVWEHMCKKVKQGPDESRSCSQQR